MSDHYWGDAWFEKYGQDLYDAECYIGDYVHKYSRCRLSSKEKYGTIRYEHIFPPGSFVIPSLRAPWKKRSVWGRYRPTLWSWESSYIYDLWCKLGKKVLRKAVYNAIKKWPHIRNEILEDLGWIS